MDEKIDISKMYAYQFQEKKSPEYDQYLQYLKICTLKQTKYQKSFVNGQYILFDKKDKKKKIILTPTQFINLNEFQIKLHKTIDLLLYQISEIIESNKNITNEIRDQFNRLKEKYIILQQKIKEVDIIYDSFYQEINALITTQIIKTNELAEWYQKRTHSYTHIKTMISSSTKKEWIQLFHKHSKQIPSITEKKKLAISYQIPVYDVDRWFEWIESSYHYLRIQKEIQHIYETIQEKEKQFDSSIEYMIIKEPHIEK